MVVAQYSMVLISLPQIDFSAVGCFAGLQPIPSSVDDGGYEQRLHVCFTAKSSKALSWLKLCTLGKNTFEK